MPYRVELTPTAEAEIEEVYRHIHADAPQNAERWKQRLGAVFDSLQLFPEACGLFPENDEVDFEIRQTFHGVYRILLTVIDDRVLILHFRHGARGFLKRRHITRPV